MSTLHHSAPPAANNRPQFDHATGSFRHSSEQQRSQPQFDGNMSLNALRASMPPERSQRPFDGGASMREGMVSTTINEGQFDQNMQHVMSERLGSSRIEEEDEEILSTSMPTGAESILQSRMIPPKKGSSSRRVVQHKDSGGDGDGGGSSSWLNYDSRFRSIHRSK